MKPHVLILTCFILQAVISYAQANHKKAFYLALRHNEIGKEISFSKTNGEDDDSLALVYLGNIKTKGGRHLKILTSRWYRGTSPGATSRIIIFNQKNQYLGDYYLAMTDDVPDKIKGSFLVFINNKESDCTPDLITKISFRKGIPERFFLK